MPRVDLLNGQMTRDADPKFSKCVIVIGTLANVEVVVFKGLIDNVCVSVCNLWFVFGSG